MTQVLFFFYIFVWHYLSLFRCYNAYIQNELVLFETRDKSVSIPVKPKHVIPSTTIWINNGTLVAESRPEEKPIMISVLMNILGIN